MGGGLKYGIRSSERTLKPCCYYYYYCYCYCCYSKAPLLGTIALLQQQKM